MLDAVRRIVQALRVSARRAERDAGLSGAQLFVLHRLADAGGGPLSVNDLAARTFTHQSTVSVVVARLADRGLVARVRSAADGRRAELSLTAAGRRLLSRAPAAAQDRLIAALDAMPAPSRRSLARSLERLAAAVAPGERRPPALFFEERESQPPRRPRGGGTVVPHANAETRGVRSSHG